MHKCLNCGQEFDGKFCPQCGTKWLDPEACPKCGAHHAADAKFCQECGARLDGKVSCPRCGALMKEGSAYCAECGTRLVGKTGGADTAQGEVAQTKVQWVMNLSGVILLILSALIGLVFAFVTGVSLVNDANGKVMETSMLYEYFGDVYKDIDKVRDALKEMYKWKSIGEQREFALVFPAVLGTIVSVLGLLGVVVLFGLTVFKAYQKYYKKQRVNVASPAVATYLTFVTMATVLLAMAAVEADAGDVSVVSSSLVSKVVFSAPTLAGLITGGVLMGLGVLLIAGSNYKEFKGFNSSVGAIFSVVVSALAVVVVALASLSSVGVVIDLSKFEFDYSAKASFGLFKGMQTSLMFFEDDDTVSKIVAFCTVGGVAAIALAIVSAVILFKKVPAASRGKNKGTLILCAVALGLSVLYLVFSILSVNAFVDAIIEMLKVDPQEEEEVRELIKTSYSAPIAMLVMSALAFIAEVASKFVRIKEEPVEVAEISVQAE